MMLYKILGFDFNSGVNQYRTWIVANNPDLNAQFYTGYKAGSNPLINISAYAITNSNAIVDFNLPTPSLWNPPPGSVYQDFPIRKTLPFAPEDSSLAVIDGYVYLFGGKTTSHIFIAPVSDPTNWTDSGATLPSPLYGSSLVIVDGYIYLFGGNNGSASSEGASATNTIFQAPISNPLAWSNTNATLPHNLQYSALGMANGNLYLFGGRDGNGASNVILTASTSNPLSWSVANQVLPTPTYGSCLAQVDGYWILYGGMTSGGATGAIYTAPVNNPFSWTLAGSLPYAMAFAQFITMGNDGYMIGPVIGQDPFTGFTSILQVHLNQPYVVFDTGEFVRGQISHSNIAIIYDRIWLFGGSGNAAIFACNQIIKYDFTNPIVINYGNITRVAFPMTDNLDQPFQALGFPYWKTDYSMSVPPIPPVVPMPISIINHSTAPLPPYI